MRATPQPATRTLRGALVLGLICTVACVDPPGQTRPEGRSEAEAKPAGPKRTATIPADGWNEAIAWRGLEEGLAEAKQSGMPIMMVVHTAWCGNCKKLKRSFADDQLVRMSERFVMVHVDQDVHPEATLYGPDGQYIPRVMFLDSDGNIDQRLQNPNRQSRYHYFYTPQEDLVASMREALDRHGNKT